MFVIMVYLLIGKGHGNQGMRLNDVFICLNERWNENQSGGFHLKLKIITRIFIISGEVGMGILILNVIILLPFNF